MNIRTAVALSASLAAMTSTALAAGQCRTESAATLTPLIELYTSEGCNSCPPADRWLRGLRADGIAPQKVTALAFHVDYWDYIGWKDRFASPAYGVRQQAAVRRAGGRTVYTPQVMLDGADLRNWRSAALPAPSQPARARLTLTGSPAADGGWDVVLEGRSEVATRLTLLLTQNGLSSSVAAGENRGVRLEHDFVVRSMAEQAAGDLQFTMRHHFAPANQLRLTDSAVVALAHDADGKLLQSLTLPWCP